jgi:hypothetical protein
LTKTANAAAGIGLANRMHKLNHGVHDGLVASVVGVFGDKRLVDLERADEAALQVLQTGITRPKVILRSRKAASRPC